MSIVFGLLFSAIFALVPKQVVDLKNAGIVGGTSVGSAYVYPFVVAIVQDNTVVCGGALISSNRVLTAGHCLSQIDYTNAVVYAHRFDLRTSLESEDAAAYRILGASPHPNYISGNTEYDAAILSLELIRGRTPAVQVYLDTGYLVTTNQFLTVAGWGDLRNFATVSGSPIMMEVPLPVTTDAVCIQQNPIIKNIESQFCAGYIRKGRDACFGDSGGPAFVKNSDGTFTLGGIVGLGQGCGIRPSVFTKVYAIEPWIRRYL
ncbi:trypsin-like cysteine/serine peptidase domain-containing protein [Globomyces pollinis-pini]|nr:trypsin-like cysteine/serine peptidase domain-containing protein [Globomyces pollinis-pini]